MTDVAVLASGGLDSAVLLEAMSRSRSKVFPVYIACGLRWEAVEQHWLQSFVAALERPAIQAVQVLNFDIRELYGPHWSTTEPIVPTAVSPAEADYLPGRNLILLAKTAVFCYLRGLEAVAMGHLRSNPHPDSTPDFFDAFARVVAIGMNYPLQVLTPFRDLTKAEVIARGRDLPLHLTFTCIDPVGLNHCGRCLHCAERHKAFEGAGIPDPTAYRPGVLR